LNNVLGVSVISLFIAGYLACFLSQNIFKKTTAFSLILNFIIAIFVYQILLIVLFAIFSITFDFRFLSFIVGIIYNLVLALPIFYGLKKIQS
jgi:hypothetical protein